MDYSHWLKRVPSFRSSHVTHLHLTVAQSGPIHQFQCGNVDGTKNFEIRYGTIRTVQRSALCRHNYMDGILVRMGTPGKKVFRKLVEKPPVVSAADTKLPYKLYVCIALKHPLSHAR